VSSKYVRTYSKFYDEPAGMTEFSYDIGGRSLPGYLADGSGDTPAPGVLVLHEASGLGDHAKRKADMLAALGYVAFAPDLFGEPVASMDEAMAMVRAFSEDWQGLRARCGGALAALQGLPNVDATRTAAIGFCFGGQAAIELGRSGADLGAIIGFHSGLRTQRPEDNANIKARVLVCLGDSDPLIPGALRDGFMENMTASTVDCQMLLFSGVGHSFTNPEVDALGIAGIRYDARAERRAWAAMRQLLAETFDADAS
jgi:dienelactone hydrolase